MTASGLPGGLEGVIDGPLALSSRIRGDGTVVVSVVGEVDGATVAPLRSMLGAHLERRPPELVLDLSGVRFLGSAGLSLLVETHEAAGMRDIGLRLIATTRAVTRALQVTGLIDLFTVSGDRPG